MPDEQLLGIAVPGIVFGAAIAIVWISFYFQHRNRKLMHDSVLAAIERSGAADPQLIAAITRQPREPRADLRSGMILVAVALAAVILAFAIGGGAPNFPVMGIAAFPGLVGVAFILFHLLGVHGAVS
jgi:hypothetical protein